MRYPTVTCLNISPPQWHASADCAFTDPLAVFRFELPSQPILVDPQVWLLPEEMDRANRYYREADQHRFLYTRSILRLLLSRYLFRAPHTIRFGEEANHKPVLLDAEKLQFNVAHSGRWSVLAISHQPVGVDVEEINPTFAFTDLLPTSFSADEQARITSAPDVRTAFYTHWTRKEALAKATGKGIDDAFARLPAAEGQQVVNAGLLGSEIDWTVASFALTEGYTAALAYPTGQALAKFYSVDSGLFVTYPS